MTLEDVNRLTDEELCIKIAELCGYRKIGHVRKADETPRMELEADGYVYNVPDYPNDLNAMHSVEKEQTDPQWWMDYDEALCEIAKKERCFPWNTTAAQRARAFVFTKEKK